MNLPAELHLQIVTYLIDDSRQPRSEISDTLCHLAKTSMYWRAIVSDVVRQRCQESEKGCVVFNQGQGRMGLKDSEMRLWAEVQKRRLDLTFIKDRLDGKEEVMFYNVELGRGWLSLATIRSYSDR